MIQQSELPARRRFARTHDFHGMVGRTPAMRRLYERIEKLARSPIPLLVEGETGTGKEMVALAVRQLMGCTDRYAAVNCAALPRHLIESELFGHEKGAFTGAVRRHSGLLTQVDGGLLFLDEIGDLPLRAQAKLLRALENGEYRPLGTTSVRRARFRLIAASNQDLKTLVEQGRFRSDLLHRLGVARLQVPSLRERRDDIPHLVRAFLERYAERAPGVSTEIQPEALDLLYRSPWPGNVRELKHVVEASIALAGGSELSADHVREFLGSHEYKPVVQRRLSDIVRGAEHDAIREALAATGGNRDRAASLLGISIATLYRRMAEMTSSDAAEVAS